MEENEEVVEEINADDDDTSYKLKTEKKPNKVSAAYKTLVKNTAEDFGPTTKKTRTEEEEEVYEEEPNKSSKAYNTLVKKTADDLKKTKQTRTEEQAIEEPVEEVVEKPEYAPVYIQHLITQEPDDKIELNKPKITSTNIKIEGFKKTINGKEVKSGPVNIKYKNEKNIKNKEHEQQVKIKEKEEEKENNENAKPDKKYTAYSKLVKNTADDFNPNIKTKEIEENKIISGLRKEMDIINQNFGKSKKN